MKKGKVSLGRADQKIKGWDQRRGTPLGWSVDTEERKGKIENGGRISQGRQYNQMKKRKGKWV